MRTNIDIDDELMRAAMRASGAPTKRAAVERCPECDRPTDGVQNGWLIPKRLVLVEVWAAVDTPSMAVSPGALMSDGTRAFRAAPNAGRRAGFRR